MLRDLDGLRVALVAGTLGQGGAERQLAYIAGALVHSGSAVRVLSLTQGEFWEEPIRRLGVPVEWVGAQPGRAARAVAITRAAKAHRADIVQSQHFYTNLYAAAAARATGAREVGAIRCNTRWEAADLGRVLGALSLRVPRIVAANSRAAIQAAVDLGVPAGRLRFLPNVVDTARFDGGGRPADGTVRVLGVGRAVRQKRFDRFLDVIAATRARTRGPVRGVLVTTSGDQEADLAERASRLGLNDGTLELRRAVADMAAVYRSADILLLTSDWEGTPNVVLEAMASGLPVVATNVGGVPDIVHHDITGLLSDPGDDGSLVTDLVRLIDCDRERSEMGRRAHAFVRERHGIETLPGRLLELYERVTAR
ncbi:MAG: glycosyltransferase family 4 protein [Vicinamibacterales bacterium]